MIISRLLTTKPDANGETLLSASDMKPTVAKAVPQSSASPSETTSVDSPSSPMYMKDNGSSDDIDVFQKSNNHRDVSWNHPAHH